MRIAFLTTEYPTEPNFDGGLANYLKRVAMSLAEQGHHPVVIVAADRDGFVLDQGVEVWRVGMPKWCPSEMANRMTLFRLHMTWYLLRLTHGLNRHVRRLHRSRPFDIIQYPHLHALALMRSPEIPAVVRLSGWGPLWREKGDGSGNRMQGFQQFALEKRALLRADAVYGPSAVIAQHLEKEIRRPIRVIENPFVLDTPSTDDSVWKRELAGKTYLLFVGQLLRLKGLLTIAETLEPLLERHPRLIVAFAGKEWGINGLGRPMMDHVRDRAGRHRDRVLHLGKLRHEQLYPIVANARAVWLPSLIDNFPNACLEAMAHGRVVIGTRGASFEQLIDHGQSGLLVEPGDAAGLIAAAEEALAMSDERRAAIGERAKARIRQLDPRIACGRLLDFYAESIDLHRRTR